MKTFNRLAILCSAVATLAMSVSTASAAVPYGVWERPSNGAHFEVFDCKDGVGLKVVKSPTPSFVGKVVMCGAKKVEENKWSGDILNLQDGKTYTGNLYKIDAKTIKMEGCGLGGLICRGEEMHKIK